MKIKIYNKGNIIEQGDFISMSKSEIVFKKEFDGVLQQQAITNINWYNISFCLFDEEDLPLIQETKNLIAKLYKEEAYDRLKVTDWKIIKQQETGSYSELEYEIITSERQAIRDVCNQKIDRLNNVTDLSNYNIELII